LLFLLVCDTLVPVSHPPLPDHISRVAYKARKAVERLMREQGTDHKRLFNLCGQSSSFLCSKLPDEVELANGHFGIAPHWWCMPKGTNIIIDLTATQFIACEPVHVVDWSPETDGEPYNLVERLPWTEYFGDPTNMGTYIQHCRDKYHAKFNEHYKRVKIGKVVVGGRVC